MIARRDFLLSVVALLAVGCGSGGGSVGDTNDPEKSTDDAQMNDETDASISGGQVKPEKEE